MMIKAVFAMNPVSLPRQIFTADMLAELDDLVRLDVATVITELDDRSRVALADAELLIAGWGAPLVAPDDAPRLRGIVYAGGVAATCLRDVDGWVARDLAAANARAANAVPVAEYALAMILLSGKDTFGAARRFAAAKSVPERSQDDPSLGNVGRTVGLVGFSQVARALIDLLKPFAFDVVIHSPEMTDELAAAHGIRQGTLNEVFAQSDVVSLHQPLLPQTRGQIDAALLAMLRDGATLINTARGGVVDPAALSRELRSGRIRAVLDVTDPEPLPADDPLWDLPNVVLTPHVAGSIGTEMHRIGAACLAEVRRFVAGEPFAHAESLR
ncbi:hydroxyacid dehydrogenase [Microbacterium sp. H1-D42]|uniref:hydroxyacid dehydrogenase n=1 Tax=Microbacterium sp. H1-D42 TaxID=2925844 RepID=UPI001F52BFD2|nr:hydroxyacid dehydrogenase [Microbacterium sp. H1-D42]UNK70520.1 hydroxyacid dehydrogenase [Microbacterium sp. H1-D42]